MQGGDVVSFVDACDIIENLFNQYPHLKRRFQGDIKRIIESYVNDRKIGAEDRVCFIVDRDRHNFKDPQYDNLRNQCKELGCDLYVTNPCFEFWLLMHFPNNCEFDEHKMLYNKKDKGRTFAEEILNGAMQAEFGCSYSKSKVHADKIVVPERVDMAIEKSQNWATQLDVLKTSIGTNLALLFRQMRSCSDN